MHTQSGAATFAACQQLFRYHPLAVAPPHPAPSGYPQSMVLRHRTSGFFVLTQVSDGLFFLRSWHDREGIEEEIRPGKPVPDLVRRTIMSCLPVPRHGALLGWVTCRQVTALVTVHSAPPDGVPFAVRVSGPELRVLPLEGTTKEWHWPPFTVSPLDDWRLWEYVEWRELVDVMPLLRAEAGRAFWIPAPNGRRTGHVVLTGNVRTDTFWVPAGIYADHWSLREGIDPPPAGQLISAPGAVDLSRGGLW